MSIIYVDGPDLICRYYGCFAAVPMNRFSRPHVLCDVTSFQVFTVSLVIIMFDLFCRVKILALHEAER